MPRKRSAITIAFGRAVREVRVERTYSQEGFAKHIGLDRSYYGAIERGEFNVSLDTMVKLAAGLETTVSQLLRRAGL